MTTEIKYALILLAVLLILNLLMWVANRLERMELNKSWESIRKMIVDIMGGE